MAIACRDSVTTCSFSISIFAAEIFQSAVSKSNSVHSTLPISPGHVAVNEMKRTAYPTKSPKRLFVKWQGDILEQFRYCDRPDEGRARRRLVIDELLVQIPKRIVVIPVEIGIKADILARRADAISGFQFAGLLEGLQEKQNVAPDDLGDSLLAEFRLEVTNPVLFSRDGFCVPLGPLFREPVIGPIAEGPGGFPSKR
jgi:hypothetical protein